MVLIGITDGDTKEDMEYICRKILTTRMWDNVDGSKRWCRSLKEMDYEVLLVSQFTLYSKFKGTKLDFHNAMTPEKAKEFFNNFADYMRSEYKQDKVFLGAFGEYMNVNLTNDGPVTIIADSKLRDL
ncbi:dtd [Acrasis kona]|uniref:D-aminoacyl-tRNA deacylase n=1 Tax=Acrasis kona TaxID=1008807 RepID=A0AAW2YIB4_9EUKA